MSVTTWTIRLSRALGVAAFGLFAGGIALASEPSAQGALPTTPGLTYKMYDSFAFETNGSSVQWDYNNGGRFTESGGDFVVSLDLPSGAAVEEITWYYVDNGVGTSSVSFSEIRPTETSDTVLATANSVGVQSPDIQSTNLSGATPLTTIDNSQFIYRVRTTMAITSSYRLYALRVGYRLQVSPAPAAATFNDVPTSDFGFQYIEALAAAGITGGCGGGNYCPDNPVTRRQMAIFLSKALGLHWQ